MIKWLHRLFKPHCDHCLEEMRESKACPTCEVYRAQLEVSNHEKKLLLQTIDKMNNPISEEILSETPEPITPKVVPWNVRRNQLETKAREEAQQLREAEQNKSEELKRKAGEKDAS